MTKNLQRMLQDCDDGKIDLIVTKSISRFARNTTDCLELVRELCGKGINIFFERERINTEDMDGELILTILSSMAEQESVSISQSTKWSLRKQFADGSYIIKSPPYGYKYVDGELQIDPEQAEIVRFIFDSFLSGVSTTKIVKELRDREVPTKKGGKWQIGTITGILKNAGYKEIDDKLAKLQKKVASMSETDPKYDNVVSEIYALRDKRRELFYEEAERAGKRKSLNELMDFIRSQPDEITEYDETLVRKFIEQVTVFDDYLTVRFKSGIEVNVQA